MKQAVLWFLTLVVALVVTSVSPRAAFASGAAGAAVGHALLVDRVSTIDREAERDGNPIDMAVDEQGDADGDDDDASGEGVALASESTAVPAPAAGVKSKLVAPLLRSSQSFVGLHDKVPR